MAAQFSISVLVEAIDRITSPLARIGERVGRFGAQATKGIGDLGHRLTATKNLILGAAAAIGAQKLWEGFKGWSEGADQLQKLAFRLGMTTQALQEYGFAADLQGVPQEEFNHNLDMMSKLMGQARNHAGKLYEDLSKHAPGFLKQLLATRDNAEALDLMMKALDQTTDASERAALATTLFGRGGMAMVTMVKDGYAGLQKLREEARSYGLVTDETGRAAEEFNDGLTRLQYAVNGVKNAIGAQLLPVLQPYLQKAIEWVKTHRDLIALKVTEFIRRVHDALLGMGAWLEEHKDGLFAMFRVGADAVAAAGKTISYLADLLGQIPGATEAAAIAFGIAATAMATNPQLAGLLATLTAVVAALAAIDSWQQQQMDEKFRRNHPGVQVIRKKSELDKWIEQHDPARAAERAARKAEGEAAAGASEAPVPEGVLTEGKLDEIVKQTRFDRENRGYSWEQASGGTFYVPVQLSLDDSRLPDWLRAKTPTEQRRQAEVGMRFSRMWGRR